MTVEEGNWRVLGLGASAWFEAPSQAAGAALVRRIAELTAGDSLPDVDLRDRGLRVRITEPDVEVAKAVSEAARELGLAADPSVLQELRLGIDATEKPAVTGFWRTALGYEGTGDDRLEDPLRRDPVVSIQQLDEPRPLRNRIHVDIGREPDAVDVVKAGTGRTAYGVYGLTLADHEGNEVDLVPGGELSEAAPDWRVHFGAMVFYPTSSPTQASRLATTVAELADAARFPVLVDIRPAGVTIDSGKDQWEDDEGAARPPFVELARQIQAAAHELGLAADTRPLRFVQVAIDAVDVSKVRAFWMTLLGYQTDPRPGLTDIYDPRRLNSVFMFQRMDASEVERRRQRNRIRFGLGVPQDQRQARIDVALRAGGRVLEQSPQRCLLSDPEGNEVEL
jgi:hypothetical protein